MDRDVEAVRARIVWIDADDARRDQVRRVLADRYNVVTVADARSGFAAAIELHPDLVLVASTEPDPDGFDLLIELRVAQGTDPIPVIAFSNGLVECADAPPPDDYVRTPIDSNELLARIRTQLRVTGAQRACAERLRHANGGLEQFVHAASHDLHEPLRMVRSYLELLARKYVGRLDEDADTYIGFAVDGATRMQGLLSDLLILSRLQTEGGAIVAVDSGAAMQAALVELEAVIRESNADITADALPPVMADARQLALVFQHLLANAIKFHSPGTRAQIHVSVVTDGTSHTFAVRDNGIGIAARNAERVFRVFQRLHTPAEYPGRGLGLALCKKAVERAGGRIWLESEPGGGSTFRFVLAGVPA